MLLLTGDGSHVQLPANALAGEDAITVVGLAVPAHARVGPGLRFRPEPGDAGCSRSSTPQGFRASAVVDGQVRGETPAKPVVENQWTALRGRARSGEPRADDVRRRRAGGPGDRRQRRRPRSSCRRRRTTNRLFLGRAQDDGAPTLHGRLRDVRLYRIALGDEPVATIRRNALAAPPDGARPRRGAAPEISTADIPRESPFAARLTSVPDITVETAVGMLPRLPATVPATYRGRRRGPTSA